MDGGEADEKLFLIIFNLTPSIFARFTTQYQKDVAREIMTCTSLCIHEEDINFMQL